MTARSPEVPPSPKATGAKAPSKPTPPKAKASPSEPSTKPRTPSRQDDGDTDRHPPRRRGRPAGSKTLKLETAEKIARLITNGAFINEAVRLAGLKLRTYYEWMQLGEDNHPTRKGSAKHRRFAEIVNEAIAAAHGGAQIRLYSASPEKWIQEWRRNADRARGGAGAEGAILAHVTDEDLLAETERMVMALLESGALHLRRPDSTCACGCHETSTGTEGPRAAPKRRSAAKRTRQMPRRTKRSNDAN